MRRLLRLATFIVLGGFFLLCVGVSFVGADAASKVVNTTPALIFWGVLFAVLTLSLVCVRPLRHSPISLAIHGGSWLVLLGAMYGSPIAHQLRADYFDSRRVESGYMFLREGWGSHTVMEQDLQTEVGKLPFQITLKDFSIERYPAPDERWDLTISAPSLPGAKKQKKPRHAPVQWEEGQESTIPGTELHVTVKKYIPHARPKYKSGAAPRLVVNPGNGKKRTVPAEKGKTIKLKKPKATLRIERVYENLQVKASEGKRKIVDVKGDGENPALKVAVKKPDNSTQTLYLLSQFPSHGQMLKGVDLRYRQPEPTGATRDKESNTPAAHVLVRRGERTKSAWLVPDEDEKRAVMNLGEMFPTAGSSGGMESPHGAGGSAARLFMLKPQGQVKSYKSKLAVLEEDETVRRKTIEVNDPLHYGGYHFYQHSYRGGGRQATILQVKSDAGLWAVYAGFALLAGGIFAWCWFKPLARVLKEEEE